MINCANCSRVAELLSVLRCYCEHFQTILSLNYNQKEQILSIIDCTGTSVFAYIDFFRREEAIRAIAKGVRYTQVQNENSC